MRSFNNIGDHNTGNFFFEIKSNTRGYKGNNSFFTI